MAKASPELKRIIAQYKKGLVKTGIQPEKILLYGSQASGIAREGSDIDLFIISSDTRPNHTPPASWKDGSFSTL
jgi:predicted nucleotidyltransferase